MLLATVEGTLDGQTFSARSRGPQLATLLAGAGRVPVDIDLSVADSTLALHGSVARGPEAELRIGLAAKRVDALLALGGVASDARGALTASAQLKLTPPARYAFEDLQLRLGESALSGRAVADWSAARPAIDVKLSGPTLRLRDIGLDETEAESQAAAEVEAEAQASVVPPWIEPLRRYDGALDLAIGQLHAAGELVGSLKLGARLEAGRLRIAPLEMRLADRRLRALGEIDARGTEPSYRVQAALKRYDLTPLLRSFYPKSVGSVSMDARAALRSRGLGEAVVANLDGTADVATYGSGIGAGALQRLGVSLLELTLRTLDTASSSKVNCAVGVFDVDKGLMKSRALFIDTTRLRIIGNLNINLSTRTLEGGLRPHPKQPKLFAVDTPLSVSGTLGAPKVSLASGMLPSLLIRYSNPYTMFLGALTGSEGGAPDGSDDCRAAYAKASESRPVPAEGGPRPFGIIPWIEGDQ
jgi:uncharacterized protein involved in outer membrane biogenesis